MPEFRRKVLDLVEAGRPVAEVEHDLGVSDQSIYTWRRQDRIDRGIEPGLTSSEKVELTQAKQRIAELETELRATQRAVELTREVVSHRSQQTPVLPRLVVTPILVQYGKTPSRCTDRVQGPPRAAGAFPPSTPCRACTPSLQAELDRIDEGCVNE